MGDKRESGSWIEALSIPAILLFSYLLEEWLPTPSAVGAAVLLTSSLLYPLTPRRASFKMYALVSLLAAAVGYGVAAFCMFVF